ncbi:MAG: formate dehydrogenase subunit gamma [Steroidobacteraceae bacterium]
MNGTVNEADATLLMAVDQILARIGGQLGPLLPVLHAVQEQLGFIPAAAIARIAQALNLSRAEVHGVASFYHYFRSQPPGRHTLRLCRAEACQAMQGEALAAHVRKRLGIDYGEITPDGTFGLEAVYCLGNCAAAPSALIDEKLYGRLSAQRMDELLEQWRRT